MTLLLVYTSNRYQAWFQAEDEKEPGIYHILLAHNFCFSVGFLPLNRLSLLFHLKVMSLV